MALRRSVTPRYVPAFLAMLLPVILIYSSIQPFHELDQMRTVYLRNRSAAIAARLETLAAVTKEELETVAEDEPGVVAIEVASEPGDPALADLWNGHELFRTEMARQDGRQVFRSLIPFHAGGRLRIAEIRLAADSADFLLVHARHNIVIATVSSGVIVALAVYALWSMRRASRDERRRIELSHLAHLGKMSAVLAHEIRTPLATIKGFTQLALEQGDTSLRPMLEPVVAETQRLEQLVSDLLLYGRPPSPQIRDCDWNEVASPLAGISPVVRVETGALRFRTDADLLRHVMTNLVRNAVDALSGVREPCVRVSADADGDAVLIRVEDNGPGIAAHDVDKVFEAFYTTKASGTGLGLPIARSLTAALGGTLHLRAPEGAGMIAEVRLPAPGSRSRAAEVGV